MKTKEKITLTLLCIVYGLMCISYYPDSWAKTASATMTHLLSTVPIAIGLAILFVSILQKVAGARLPLDRKARIYLFFGIIVEFFYGLMQYATQGKVPL